MSKLAAIITLSILGIGATTITISNTLMEKERAQAAELAKQRKQEKLEHYELNRLNIFSDINSAIDNKDFSQAIKIARKNMSITNDKELKQLYQKANIRKKTEQHLVELKKMPEGDYAKRYFRYKELTALNPNNGTYKEKLDFYKAKSDLNAIGGIKITKESRMKASGYEGCVARGVYYFKDIGAYPYLSTGKDATKVARERCRRTLTAF